LNRRPHHRARPGLERLEDRTLLSGGVGPAGIVRITAFASSINQVVTAAPHIVSAVAMGPTTSTISTFRVLFDRAMVLSSFTPDDCVVTSPGGHAVQVRNVKAVANSGDRAFDIVLMDVQSTPGTYGLTVGPNVTDLAGDPMAVYQNTFQISPDRTYTETWHGAVRPNNRFVGIQVVHDDFIVAGVKVTVNISHPHVSDLYIHLQAPDGIDVVLFNQCGGDTANLIGTTFDDHAAFMVALGRGPFSGSYQPLAPLQALLGKHSKGMWKLWVEDRGGVNTGNVTSWSLVLTPKAG
jgi:subtilisin-like proprotein convertase family protein